MTTIFKYLLPTVGTNELTLPADYEMLTADFQRGQMHLWVMQTDPAPAVTLKWKRVTIEVLGTGFEVEDSHQLQHINTVLTEDHALVWHIFERIK